VWQGEGCVQWRKGACHRLGDGMQTLAYSVANFTWRKIRHADTGGQDAGQAGRQEEVGGVQHPNEKDVH